MIWITIGIIIYLAIAVVVYGIEFAYWQKTYPCIAKDEYYIDMGVSIFHGIFWWASILAQPMSIFKSENIKKNGFKFF